MTMTVVGRKLEDIDTFVEALQDSGRLRPGGSKQGTQRRRQHVRGEVVGGYLAPNQPVPVRKPQRPAKALGRAGRELWRRIFQGRRRIALPVTALCSPTRRCSRWRCFRWRAMSPASGPTRRMPAPICSRPGSSKSRPGTRRPAEQRADEELRSSTAIFCRPAPGPPRAIVTFLQRTADESGLQFCATRGFGSRQPAAG